jgi:CBS domain-containing protein
MEAIVMHTVELLRQKGSQVWTIAPEATVYEALELMAAKNIGSAVYNPAMASAAQLTALPSLTATALKIGGRPQTKWRCPGVRPSEARRSVATTVDCSRAPTA